MKRLLLIFYFIAFALIYLHTTDSFDQDLGRHLKLGEIIWQTREVPKTNVFSYTSPNEPVFNSHWGSQVIFYLIHEAFGISGLLLLSTLINTLAFGSIFFFAVRRTGLLLPSILFIPFSLLLLDRTWIRPEMFGNLFYAILLIALFSKRVRKKIMLFFPLIALAWINLHITGVFGLFTMAVVLLQDTISEYSEDSASQNVRKSDKSDGQKRWIFRVFRVFRKNALILILSIIALFVNPYGINGVLSAFTVLNKYGYTIVENQSWLFLKDFGFPLAVHIFIGVGISLLALCMMIVTKKRPLPGEIIIFAAITLLTFRFVRNEILFAYSAFLIAALHFGELARLRPVGTSAFGSTESASGQTKSARQRRLGLLGSLVILIASGFLIVGTHAKAGLPVGFGAVESYREGVAFFQKNNLQGPIFNNFDIGGYLIYRLYPLQKVFIDNRPEAYPVDFIQKVYILAQQDPAVFKKVADEYGIQTVIWGVRDITPWSRDFLAAIAKNPDWKEAYRDSAIVIYTKVPFNP